MTADDPLWKQWNVRARLALARRRGRGIPVAAPVEPYLVVPVLGQSNAHGAGLGLDVEGLDAPDPNVHQWPMSGRSRGTVVLGVDPLFHDVPSKAVGFAVSFAKMLAAATDRAVLLVPAALGDTSFTPKNGRTWDPADRSTRANLYRNAIASIDGALRVREGNRVAAILWHQGESDVPLTSGAVYATKLDSVIDGLRARYGNETPFVIGQMVPEEIEQGDPNYRVIDAVHADSVNRRPMVVYVAGPRDSYNSPTEKVHYNASGQRELGRRMWAALDSVHPVRT